MQSLFLCGAALIYISVGQFPIYGQNIGVNGSNATLDLFNETLGSNNRFRIASVGIFSWITFVDIQLRDTAQRPLMTIMIAPGQSIPGGRHTPSVSVHQVVNTSGQILLMSRSVAGSATIWSGVHILGILDFNDLTAKDHMGHILLRSVVESSSGTGFFSTPSAFTLQDINGVILARIEQPTDNSEGCVLSLIGSDNIDLRTKALVIYSGYVLYSRYLEETECGRIGQNGYLKRCCCYPIVIIMVLCICIGISIGIYFLISFIISR